jgi:hypothetical protein
MAKPDPTRQIINEINELAAVADLMQEKVSSIKEFCRKAKATMGGVSTTPIKKDLEKIATDAVAKRRARMKRA